MGGINCKKIKLIILCAILISSSILLSGCSKNGETIKIGIAGTMSGINSDFSVSGRRGVELAVDEFNKAGGLNGRKIELVVKDDKNDPDTALIVDKEFINENIPVVIGHYTSGMMVNSMDYLKNKDILFLSPTISADSLSGLDDNFIRFTGMTNESAIVLADTAKKNNNRKFAVIYDIENKGFNDALFDNFKRLLEENQGEVILTKTYTSSVNVNYSSLTKDIAESDAEALLIISGAVDNALITQQLRKMGSKVQIYSSLWSNTGDLIKNGGAAIEGMFIVGAIDLDGTAPELVRFKEEFLDQYGENPTYSAVLSYEATTTLFQAMKMGPDLEPTTLKNNIIRTKDFKGLDTNYQIDKYGDNIRNFMIFKLENGKLRKVD